MEEREGAEYVGKPPPREWPQEEVRHPVDVQNTDLGAMRVRGGEWSGANAASEEAGPKSQHGGRSEEDERGSG